MAEGCVLPQGVAAVGFYGQEVSFACGSAGGWDEFGPVRQVTRSAGHVLHELDGRPALDLYELYLGEEAADLPAAGLLYPLKIWDPAHPDEAVVRTLVAIDRAASTVTFVGDIPMGWNARLMRGAADNLTAGAAEAARRARQKQGPGLTGGLCLFVSCVGRRLALGQRTEDEVEAICDALPPGTQLIGFYSHGEIAPLGATGRAVLHNQTATLMLLAESVP